MYVVGIHSVLCGISVKKYCCACSVHIKHIQICCIAVHRVDDCVTPICVGKYALRNIVSHQK